MRLTREIATRRINLALPAESLMIQKTTGAVPHTGGTLFKLDSELCQPLMRWLEAGAPQDSAGVAKPVSLEILPRTLVLEGEGATQRMTARAKYSDGTDRDVTHLALFLSNNDNSAKIDKNAVVTAGKSGEAFIMARFATFTVGSQAIVIPKDLKYTWPSPPENNYVDNLVNNKLKKLRITRRSTFARICQKRTAVAMKWGMEIAATAIFVPTCMASSGVSRLPMPNPATDATAPATAATMKRSVSNIFVFDWQVLSKQFSGGH